MGSILDQVLQRVTVQYTWTLNRGLPIVSHMEKNLLKYVNPSVKMCRPVALNNPDVAPKTSQLLLYRISLFQGCYEAFMTKILSNASIVIGLGVGLGVVQILGIFLAFCLCKSIDQYLKWSEYSCYFVIFWVESH